MISDLAQTNIGLGQEDYNIGGTTILHDNKMFLYYDGNHRICKARFNERTFGIIYPTDDVGQQFGQKIQNALFLVLPKWYKDGLSAYMGKHGIPI